MGREISNTFLCSFDLNKIVCLIKSRLFVGHPMLWGKKSRFSVFVGVTGQDEGIPFHSFFRVLWDGEIGATATAAAEIYEMEKGGKEGRGWRGTKKNPPPTQHKLPLFSLHISFAFLDGKLRSSSLFLLSVWLCAAAAKEKRGFLDSLSSPKCFHSNSS